MARPRPRLSLRMFAIAACVLVIFAVVGRIRRKKIVQPMRVAPTQQGPREIRVPRGTGLKLDGELDEPSWTHAARTTFLQQDGTEARPYSDIRLLWGDGMLHVGLYAADHDIVSARAVADGPVWQGDSFHVVLDHEGHEFTFDVGPTGVLTDGDRKGAGPWNYAWQSGARLACDTDGTVDHPGDNDEEWVVEMDIPLSAIGLLGEAGERIDIRVHRCDVKEVGKPPLQTPCPQIEPMRLVLE